MADEQRVPWTLRRSQVEEISLRHERDGISYEQLAAEAGVSLVRLYGWNRRLRRERRDLLRRGKVEPKRKGFVEVKSTVARTSAPNGGGIELVLASGLRIRVERDFEEATLKRLLLLLGA